MKLPRPSVRLLATLAAAAAIAACGDSADQQLTPQPAALSAGKLPRIVATLGRPQPLAADITRNVTVTNTGGKLEIKEAGLKLEIPANALPAGQSSMTITVTAFKGSQYAYEFEPSGTAFRQPLKFEQNMGDASLGALFGGKVAYFRSRADLRPSSGLATTYEDLLTDIDLTGKSLRAKLWHFSGYILEW